MRPYAVILSAAALAVLAACSDQSTTGPTRAVTEPASGAPPIDSSHSYSGTFTVHGRVLGVTAIEPAPGVQDTLSYAPIPGAKIRVVHNLLVNGEARQELAAETVSDANGAYSVRDLEAGYYIVEAAPPAGSLFGAAQEYLAGQSPDVTLDVYLWKQQQ